MAAPNLSYNQARFRAAAGWLCKSKNIRSGCEGKVNEAKLIVKLRLIEPLYAGAKTEGEKDATDRARQRILERLQTVERADPRVEYRFGMCDMWQRRAFTALPRRYGIKPYRYSGQRHTTVMAKVPKRSVDETLWPESQEISRTLRNYLSEITERVFSEVIHRDSSQAEVVEEPKRRTAALKREDEASAGQGAP